MTSTNLSAIIVGAGGQDGILLTEYLKGLDYVVHGIAKNDWNICDPIIVNKLICEIRPREVYFLAAYHHSSEDAPGNEGDLFRESFNVHTIAATNFLDAIARFSPESRFFYASSCLIFSATGDQLQTENTIYSPETPYAISKVAGMSCSQYYRNSKGVFACVGILYNHESPLRSPRFVTRKIAQAAAKISIAREGSLVLGNLEAKVDWGYAPDFVAAMHQMLQMSVPKDFIVATGEVHTVREFVEIAFTHVGLNYLDYVIEKADTLSRTNRSRVGDSTRLKQELGWRPSISFDKMVKLMVDAELNSLA